MADDTYVLLCTCREAGELQMVRAALEARGVPVRIEGAAIHGVLGMIHGAALAPRVMVPSQWRSTAREIVAEIVGPFDEEDQAPEDRAKAELPFRVPAGDDEADQTEDEVDDPIDDAEDEDDALEPTPPPKRSFAVPVMLGLLGLPWGFGHVYAKRPGTGIALMAIAAAAAGAWLAGVSFAVFVLAAVGLTDVVGSMFLVARYNRALLRATPI